jgi:hypothetical protein
LNDVSEVVSLKVGKLQYFLAALTFVPGLGFLIGIVLLPINIFSKKIGSNRIALIAALGIIFWVLISLLYQPEAPKPVTLKNGNVIYPLKEGVMYFTEETDAAYSLSYQTGLDLDNEVKLREEAEYVWMLAKPNVERNDYKIAVLSASTPMVKTGLFTHSSSHHAFVLKKSENNKWSFRDQK